MQEEATQKTISISVRTTKMTAKVLQEVLNKFLELAKKQILKPAKGEQSVKDLVKTNASLSNIEITDGNIGAFKKTAKKYGVDFALKKDKTESPPKYLVFFKGANIDVMQQAFKEFAHKKNREKTSIISQLKQGKKEIQNKKPELERSNKKERGMEI